MTDNTAPQREEAEVSLFGPGIGECIIAHLGDAEWIIIDSCINRKTNKPIAVEYLNRINVDLKTSVKCFVITHWHDDHINGAFEILKECTAAQFVCSSALRSQEFLSLTSTYSKLPMTLGSGIDELCRIFEELKNRSSDRRRTVNIRWAHADRQLLRKEGVIKAEIFSLSPSDKAFGLSIREIGQLIPRENAPKRRIVAQYPNHVSVVLWVTIADYSILLGSDLENVADGDLGWKAVISSSTRPSAQALIVKVPHHGSRNAYSEHMWREMAAREPIGLLTPYSRGNKPLPTGADIMNIQKHTSQLFITGDVVRRPEKMDAPVTKTIREMVRARKALEGPIGHIRVRFSLTENTFNPNIELFEGAKRL